MTKEIPILYSTPMVQAKLAGRKTQTRRIAKNHPGNKFPEDDCWYETRCSFQKYFSEDYAGDGKDKELGPTWLILNEDGEIEGFLGDCPYGQPGDLLWGRENWKPNDLPTGWPYHYYANNDTFTDPDSEKWKPSIHMPKVAARIWDEVTGIRVQRIAEISEEDCIAEGIEISKHSRTGGTIYKCYDGQNDFEYNPKESFRSLWQSINGKPKPIQARQNGKLVTVGYEVYPFDEQDGKEFASLTTWRGKPLTVITNPWVWVIESKQLSVTWKP